MRRWFLPVLAILATLLPADVGAAKKIRVVTTIPDLADMTRLTVRASLPGLKIFARCP